MKPGTIQRIFADMTLLDIFTAFEGTENILKKYDHVAGECICCEMLFSKLEEVAEHYQLDLEQLLNELNDFLEG